MLAATRPQTAALATTINTPTNPQHGAHIHTGGRARSAYPTSTNNMETFRGSQPLPPFPDFTPDPQVLYLASRHRISKITSKVHRRKCESSRITRRRRKQSESEGTSSLADGSDTERCKTAESDFFMDASIFDDMDLSDEELWNNPDDIPENLPKENKFQKAYVRMCKGLRVTPSACFLNGLKTPKVSLTNYELGPRGVKPICVALAMNPKVSSLHLDGNNIGAVGAAYISDMLSENIFLTDINLAGNKLGIEGAQRISKVLMTNDIIRKINLSGNGFEEKDAQFFADMLKENHALRELNLSHNCFREKGGELLGPSLIDNTSLEVLDVSWNHLRRRGAVAISDGIKNNIGLKSVNLAWNGFHMEGCKALNKALVVNRTLSELNVSCNRIDKKCLDELLKGLIKNESIEVFRVGENPLTTDGAINILKMLERKPTVPLKVLDIAGQCVDSKFVELLGKIKEKRKLECCHGNLLRKDDAGGGRGTQSYIEGDPMMILMEFMRLQNLRLVDLFVCLDTDGSKTLTHKEFREGLMKVNIPVSPQGLDFLIKKLDADGDGEVDYAELIQGQKEHKRKLAKLTKKSKEEDTAFEDTEIGVISNQVKALITLRDAAKKEALSKKRTGLASIVNQAMQQPSRPSSDNVTTQLTAPPNDSTGNVNSANHALLSTKLQALRPASSPNSNRVNGATTTADRFRRVLTPAANHGASLGATLSVDSGGWSTISSATHSDISTPPGRRSPQLF